jgi:peptidoglycan/LPS O-acetylase OafA/YrhL
MAGPSPAREVSAVAPPSGRFEGLDGLRGVAILLVLLWHTAIVTRFPVEAMGPLRPLVMSGWAGVDLFFALSGFLITALLLREEQRSQAAGHGRTFSAWRFYARRALRILPVFYAVFLLKTYFMSRYPVFTSIRVTELWAAHSPLGLLPYATFWGTYFLGYLWPHFGQQMPTHPGEAYDVYWSLYVEEHFYLLWPLFLLLVRSSKLRLGISLAICLLLPLLRFWAVHRQGDLFVLVQQVSHYRIDSILWGGVAALAFSRLTELTLPARQRRLLLGLAAAAVVALVLGGQLSMRPRGTALGLGLGLTLLALGTALLLVELVAAPRSRLCRALQWRPLAVIGRLSFAAYLIHMPMMDLARAVFFASPRGPHVGNLLLAFVLFAALTLVAAAVLHWTIERPFLALKDRYLR